MQSIRHTTTQRLHRRRVVEILSTTAMTDLKAEILPSAPLYQQYGQAYLYK
jgi:hypothetical protein